MRLDCAGRSDRACATLDLAYAASPNWLDSRDHLTKHPRKGGRGSGV